MGKKLKIHVPFLVKLAVNILMFFSKDSSLIIDNNGEPICIDIKGETKLERNILTAYEILKIIAMTKKDG